MKLIKAHIKNFRLLKEVELDFSTQEDRPLTVIRAANETGKTTSEYALMWCLYGSSAVLPKKGDYQLCPADLKKEGVRNVTISVEIEFEYDRVINVGKGNQEIEKCRYRIIRSCVERPFESESYRRSSEDLKMYQITAQGTELVSEAEAKNIIEDSLPETLKDVYFTDGDSAMSFIEAAAAQGVKRKRVSNAVESLLGLEMVKSTVRHLGSVSSKFSKEIDNTDYAKELEILNDRIQSFEEDIEEWEAETQITESQLHEGNVELKSIRKKIEDALKLGDKQKLVTQLNNTKKKSDRAESSKDIELSGLAKLVSDEKVSKSYLMEDAKKAKDILNNLNKEKKLPKVNIPILEELLEKDNCFCGAVLKSNSDDAKVRRGFIADAIEGSRTSDAIQEVATGLYYRIRSENYEGQGEPWLIEYQKTSSSYQNTISTLHDLENELKEIDETIKNIDDSLVQELKQQEEMFNNKILNLSGILSSRTTQVNESSQRKKEAEESRKKLEGKVGKTNVSSLKLALSRECEQIFNDIIERLKKDELKNVSNEMNRIFLEMIGSDPESNDLTLITKAELTEEYDILVYGPNNHVLNPDQDLNGASRRAITLAFILALTKVSEVEAPNVIDTPLGMMSGYVKQSVLLQTLKEGSQVILFLTPDEIKGVEAILDKHAGMVYTLTNPAHYPKMLVNKPTVDDSRIIRCDCNHREICNVCERKDMEMV